MALTAVSLFSGLGGFDYGATLAGIDVVWANDIEGSVELPYRSMLPEVEFVAGDVKEVKRVPKADILIGCYPCTGFSLGSRRRWHKEKVRDLKKNDDNFLYDEFLRVLKQVKPRYFIVENVRGMLSANEGWFFTRQIDGFAKLGYTVKHQLLDATQFGVPQTRKRVFLVGVRESKKALDYHFPLTSHGPGARPLVTLRDAIGGMTEGQIGEYFDYEFHGHFLTRNRKRGWDEPSYTIVADCHHVPLHPSGPRMKFVAKDKWRLGRGANRRLSWRECARIQGLPDSLKIKAPLATAYRMVGNAVPPALAKALLTPIVKFETGSKRN